MSDTSLAPVFYPRRALRVSIFLIAIECLMLAYPSGNWLVTGGLFVWAASRWWTICRGWCPSTPAFWNGVFLAVVFVAKYTFAPEVFPTDAPFVNTELAHEIGCWIVAFQVLILHETSSLKRISPSFAALGCLVILCAGDIKLHSISRNIMLLLMILFVGGLAWFAHAGREWGQLDQRRRLRRGILLATLVLAGVPTVYAARAWHAHERDLELLLLNMMQALDGNSNEARTRTRYLMTQISNGKIVEPEKLVLRVTQDAPDPLYLKGATYNHYPHRNASWVILQSVAAQLTPREVPADFVLLPNENLFQISQSRSGSWTTATIEYLSQEDPVPLAPLHTSMMKVGVEGLRIDPLHNISLLEDTLPNALTDYLPVEVEPDPAPSPEDATRRLPGSLHPDISEIAATIFAGKSSDSDKILAVEKFFHDNFQYQLGFSAPLREDPIAYFLKNRSAAHCEYFATAAAILLRTTGVPTRYITGYVPSEKHPNGVWIARRKDSHAWVEAYDSDRQLWVTVEATPSAGLPERRTASWMEIMTDSWRGWMSELLDRWNQHGIGAAIGMALQTTVMRVLLGVLLIAGWWRFSRRFRRQPLSLSSPETSRTFHFQEWLRTLESTLERRGFVREPQETLLHFRDRILNSPSRDNLRATAQWYTEYSSIRYNESEQTAARVSQLELSWQKLSEKSGS